MDCGGESLEMFKDYIFCGSNDGVFVSFVVVCFDYCG